jgi:hypothetical protein
VQRAHDLADRAGDAAVRPRILVLTLVEFEDLAGGCLEGLAQLHVQLGGGNLQLVQARAVDPLGVLA